MLRFAANLTMMYTEYPFLERFARAADDGFQGVECLFPYEYAPEILAEQLHNHGVQQILFNTPPGEWSAGDRGIACLPNRTMDFQQDFLHALHYARILHCPRIHVMAGLCPPELARSRALDVFRANLTWALDTSRESAVDLLIEPLNTRDMPGYLLSRQEEAHALVQELASDRLKVQMDLYHCQIMEGDLTARLRAYLGAGSRVGHIQIAGVPDRQEPNQGEVNYGDIFHTLEQLGYEGWIACEYRPRAGTSSGLGWLRDYQRAPGCGRRQ